MRILFWLEPHSELARPAVMKSWLCWFERISEALCQAAGDVDYRIVCLESPATSARAAFLGERLILLSQAELRAQWRLAGNAFIQLEHDLVPNDVCAQLLVGLHERLGGFEPEVVFLLNQQPWLRRGFPGALFVNIELSWISRAPFPTFWQLDIVGAGKGRVLANYLEQVLASLTLDEGADDFVGKMRSIARERLTNPTAEHFVQSLRDKYNVVTLLPIGIFDNFDGQTPFFAVLEEFLGGQSGETALVLSQHPFWQLLNCEQIAYLASKYPYVQDGSEIGSQYLLPWVDHVIGDFSTVATQALFFDTQVISVRHELNHFPVDTPLLNPLVDILARAGAEQRRKILYWLLSYYAVPEARLIDGAWLGHFLRRAIEAVRAGQPWSAYEKPTATIKDWAESEWRFVPEKAVLQAEARLYISEIVDGIPEAYTESRGATKLYPVSNQRQTLRLPMPADLKPLAHIRLDPANCQVALWLHRLDLVQADGSTIWRWSGDLAGFASIGGLVIRSGAEGLLLLSLDNDPRFDLVLPGGVLASLTANASLVVELTPQPWLEVVPEVLHQDDRLISELRAGLMNASLGIPANATKSSLHLASDLENMASLLKNSLARRDQTIIEQSMQIRAMRDELLRAEAQLDLLKDVMLSGGEEDRL